MKARRTKKSHSLNESSPSAAAFDQACAIERPLDGIRNFAIALCRVSGTLRDDDGVIVLELASTIRAHVRELYNIHKYFFRLHHPDGARFEREGWPE
jgi:hypothetical protein